MKIETLWKVNSYLLGFNLGLLVVTVTICCFSAGCGTSFLAGPPGPPGKDGLDGGSCTATYIPIGDPVLPKGGALITCGATLVLVSNGSDGLNGQNGQDGADGAQGPSGETGPQGDPGAQGDPGVGGLQGEPGVDAPASSYAIVGVVDPCGPQSFYDEVFMRLTNGKLIALFTDNVHGDNPRLSQIGDGSFMTTDGTNCYFTISTSSGIRTISWTGGSESWTME